MPIDSKAYGNYHTELRKHAEVRRIVENDAELRGLVPEPQGLLSMRWALQVCHPFKGRRIIVAPLTHARLMIGRCWHTAPLSQRSVRGAEQEGVLGGLLPRATSSNHSGDEKHGCESQSLWYSPCIRSRLGAIA